MPQSTHTLAASACHLSEWVVTVVALAPNDTRLAGALASVRVTCAGLGTHWEAVTWVAGVLALWPVVVILHNGHELEPATGQTLY